MNKGIINSNCYIAVLLGALIVSFTWLHQVKADSSTWINHDTDDPPVAGDFNWATASNWSAGIPTSTGTAIFDGYGSSGTITVGNQSVATIQFGQTSETSGASIPGYILGSGTLNFAVSTVTSVGSAGASIINYYGTANTTDQTIYSDISLTGSSTGIYYQINNLSSGNLVFAGDVVNATPSQQTSIQLGTYGSTAAYGNVVLQGNAIGVGNASSMTMRFLVNGTTGSLIFDNATGINSAGTGGYSIFLTASRSSQAAPHLEIASGNNIIQSANGSGGIAFAYNQTTAGNYYIKVDTGASLAVGNLYHSTNTVATGTTNLYLYGGGDGVLYGALSVRKANNVALVKDGAGAWAFTGAAITTTYQAGTTIRDGIFLVSGSGATGGGTVLVDPTGSFDGAGAKPILGGKSVIDGAVIVKNGATIAPGGSATGGAATLATVSTPLGDVGTLTLKSSLTTESGAIFAMDINTDGAFSSGLGISDQLIVNGVLTLGSATLSLNDIGLGSATLTSGDYFTLLNYTSSLSGIFNGLAQGDLISVGNNEYSIDYGTLHANQITLNWVAAIPEPSTWAMLLGGFGLLVVLRTCWHQRRSNNV